MSHDSHFKIIVHGKPEGAFQSLPEAGAQSSRGDQFRCNEQNALSHYHVTLELQF
jgi:hypothetical protein